MIVSDAGSADQISRYRSRFSRNKNLTRISLSHHQPVHWGLVVRSCVVGCASRAGVGYDESSFRVVIVMCRMMMISTDRGRGYSHISLWTRLFSKTKVPTHVYKSLVVPIWPTLQKIRHYGPTDIR